MYWISRKWECAERAEGGSRMEKRRAAVREEMKETARRRTEGNVYHLIAGAHEPVAL